MPIFDAFMRDPASLAANLMASTAYLYARGVESAWRVAAATNPIAAALLEHYEQNPNGWRINGIRKETAKGPFAKLAGRMPDSIGFQFGHGTPEEDPEKSQRPRPTTAELTAKRHKAIDSEAVMRNVLERNYSDDRLPRDFRSAVFKASVTAPWRNIEGAAFLTELTARDHAKAEFTDLMESHSTILGERYDLRMETVETLARPHAGMLRFSTAYSDAQPTDSNNVIYLKAPMSGHYATLIYNAIQNYIDAGFTVYVEDKTDAADVPWHEEDHGIEAQADYDCETLAYIHKREGTRAQLTAICQAAIPAVIASAALAQQQAEHRPGKLCIMSAPIDVSINPSLVNQYAEIMPDFLIKFRELEIVPPWRPGFLRTVRSGSTQVSGFESGNMGRFMQYYASIFNYITTGGNEWDKHKPLLQAEIMDALQNPDLSDKERDFLELMTFIVEYKTHMDMDGRAYIDAWFKNFGANYIANDDVTYHRQKLDFSAIDFPVLTVDATDDDISSIGQTVSFLRKEFGADKRALIVPGKGHFWWSGQTAKDVQWPAIFAWHKAGIEDGAVQEFRGAVLDAEGNEQTDPAVPQPCTNPEPLITLAGDVHEKNLELERRKVETGQDLSLTLMINGTAHNIPLISLSPQVGHA